MYKLMILPSELGVADWRLQHDSGIAREETKNRTVATEGQNPTLRKEREMGGHLIVVM